MPFKVRFDIRSKMLVAVQTYDRFYAYLKYNEYFKKDVCTQMIRTVEPIDLTGPEKFLWLVCQARDAQRRYYDNRNGTHKELAHDFMMEAIEQEKKLDLKIAEARCYIDRHPKAQKDEKEYSFFLIVEKWREKRKEYHRYRKQSDAEKPIIFQMKRECEDYENKIDKYIQKNIGL